MGKRNCRDFPISRANLADQSRCELGIDSGRVSVKREDSPRPPARVVIEEFGE